MKKKPKAYQPAMFMTPVTSMLTEPPTSSRSEPRSTALPTSLAGGQAKKRG